jgi:hypothetical protein
MLPLLGGSGSVSGPGNKIVIAGCGDEGFESVFLSLRTSFLIKDLTAMSL